MCLSCGLGDEAGTRSSFLEILNSRWLSDIQVEISLEFEEAQTGDINLGLVST